ncbi:MAG: hypothetical protein R3E87_20790 [Burkholderiaceae bacterium]
MDDQAKSQLIRSERPSSDAGHAEHDARSRLTLLAAALGMSLGVAPAVTLATVQPAAAQGARLQEAQGTVLASDKNRSAVPSRVMKIQEDPRIRQQKIEPQKPRANVSKIPQGKGGPASRNWKMGD